MTNFIKNNRVLILGFGDGWQDYPKDYDGEVWGLNMAAVKVPRLDKLFLADKLSDKTDIKNGWYMGLMGEDKGKKFLITEEDYKRIITEKNIPFVSCHAYPDMPPYEAYPIKEVYERFGSDYFANCIAYMIAYAILKGAKEIELWGVRQGLLTEYAFHKGCVEFWIGIALGLGINVSIRGDSHLLRTTSGKLYGYRKEIGEIIN